MTEKMQMMKMIVLKVILDSFEDDYLDYEPHWCQTP